MVSSQQVALFSRGIQRLRPVRGRLPRPLGSSRSRYLPHPRREPEFCRGTRTTAVLATKGLLVTRPPGPHGCVGTVAAMRNLAGATVSATSRYYDSAPRIRRIVPNCQLGQVAHWLARGRWQRLYRRKLGPLAQPHRRRAIGDMTKWNLAPTTMASNGVAPKLMDASSGAEQTAVVRTR
jgi:hypothetical protein